MEINLWLVIIIFLWAGIASALLAMYQKQIRDFKEQIQFIKENHTNLTVTTKTSSKNIQELAEQINKVIEGHRKLEIELEKSNETFRKTITSISHDLRTPLTSANGYIQMLRKGDLPRQKEEQYIIIIEERIQVVKEMLDQLFEYARIESNELPFEERKINVNNILIDTISLFYEEFTKKNQKPNLEICNQACYIKGDEKALKRVFQNIISNSLIHGKGDFEIKLSKKNQQIKIQFKNKTDTIEPSDINQIFERFYTTDNSRSKKTTGLGLSIAKNFIDSMNGKISAALEGEEFKIRIELEEY